VKLNVLLNYFGRQAGSSAAYEKSSGRPLERVPIAAQENHVLSVRSLQRALF